MRVFNNPEFGSVRTVIINGEIWFVGKDVAGALGYSNSNDAIITHVDEEDRLLVQMSDIQDPRNPLPSHMKGSKVVIINGSGMCS